ncbi:MULTISPECIES: O-antigen polymerase [Enorma]|uniref:O-antigen polymerase n=1 Tax=Enorma TaxID=1472762 RepID=UPI000377E364|nr:MULTISPECIES: O-antigen polymerase [Enorma]
MRVLLICMALLVCLLSFALTKGRLYPVNLFTVVFTASIIGALAVFEEEQWGFLGILWMIVALALVNVGFSAGFGRRGEDIERGRGPSSGRRFNESLARLIVLLLIVSGMLWLANQLRASGVSFSVFFSADSLMEVGPDIAAARYSGETNSSAFTQILTSLTYSAPLCGGYLYLIFSTRKDKALCIATMLPITLLMLLTNAKAGFIGSLILWLAGYLVAYIQLHCVGIPWKSKPVLISAGLVLFALLLMFLTFLLRIGSFETWAVEAASKKFGIYAFGGIFNFDHWLSAQDVAGSSFQFGTNTFMSLFSALGVIQKAQGVYEPLLVGYGNIFTSFRGLIQDFSWIGALIILFLVGFIEGRCVDNVSKRGNGFAGVALAAITFFYMFSVFISPWVYTTYVVPFVVFMLMLAACNSSRRINVVS